MTPRERLALMAADWPSGAEIHRQRFTAAMDRNDEDAAEEALKLALIAERMCEMCELVPVG